MKKQCFFCKSAALEYVPVQSLNLEAWLCQCGAVNMQHDGKMLAFFSDFWFFDKPLQIHDGVDIHEYPSATSPFNRYPARLGHYDLSSWAEFLQRDCCGVVWFCFDLMPDEKLASIPEDDFGRMEYIDNWIVISN
ncbi:MAG: hypothetical protein ACPG7F_21735 [Aggregatilineales bacterium]